MKKHTFLQRTLCFSLSSVFLLHGATSFADDTEIFFGSKAVGDDARPNVLFILDDSGSMAWCITSDSDSCSESKSRMRALKDTMQNLLDTTTGVNIGMMVLNNSAKTRGDASLPRLLQPVSNIDAAVNVKLASPEIKDSSDDASYNGSATNTTDKTLLMGYVKTPVNPIIRSLGYPNTYSNDNTTYYTNTYGGQLYTCSVKMEATSYCPRGVVNTLKVGGSSAGADGILLFRNLNIPAGVSIVNAYLDFKTESNIASSGFNLSLVNSKTPSAFNDSSPLAATFTAVQGQNSGKVDGLTHRLELKPLLTTLQGQAPSADPIGDLAVRIRSTRNDFDIKVGDIADAPQLTIEFSGTENSSRTTGLRFQTVSVPQGATITSASLSFVPASSNENPVSFLVSAENSGNAAPFAAGSGNTFASRPKTSARPWTAQPWRTENPPVYDDNSVDVTTQVQEVVNNSTWCGNNSMAFFLEPSGGEGNRTAISQDGSDDLKPMLTVNYAGGDSGCMKPIVDLSVLDEKDDAGQYNYPSNNVVFIDKSYLPFSNSSSYAAARYQRVPFKKGAVVESATVFVTPDSAKNTKVTAEVYFDNVDNSAAPNINTNNLGARPATGKTTCTFISAGPGIPVACTSATLATALQGVLGRSGWKDGNALTLLIKQTSASADLTIRSFEYSKTDAIRLQVKLSKASDLTDAGYKNRDYLKNVVNAMQANNGTPLVDRIRQAARYYTDISGKHQGPSSPMLSSCQANYLVVMTDGQANGNTNATVSDAKSLIDAGCVSRGAYSRGDEQSGETCGVEIAKWLKNTDQSNNLDDLNTVTTHTVGFALQANASAKKFLADVAAAGGGKAYTADNASDLSKAFNQIIQEALATDTTFVSATAPVNSFNRQDHKDQLYFSLFRPGNTERWSGNLKRYKMDIRNGIPLIVDQDNVPAVDANTGFFKKNARSYWSDNIDGIDVTAGGAASKLPAPNSRKVYTNTANANSLNSLDTSLTATQIGAANNTERDELVKYIRGYAPGSTLLRMAMGDPIHSTPSLVTYGCNGTLVDGVCASEIQSAIIGTNEGFVQMFDTNTGVEQFAFMPSELLSNVKRLYTNANTPDGISHLYGVDNSVTVWSNDVNENGSIDSGEFVYAYASMGRGGRNIYALNVTNPTSPSLLWTIKGGVGGFSRLGQTWSQPIKTKIKVGSVITDVLIFAGGYDPAQDAATVRTTDAMGGDLFIVNAKTGALIWSASGAGITMPYSTPSKVRAVSLEVGANGLPALNKDRLTTQLFVGDMGGQVWRFTIANGSTGNALVSGKVMASVAGNDQAGARRFYHEPEIALVSVNGVPNLSVSIGSGFRGHPLDKLIDDRLYSFRTPTLNGLDSATLSESDLYDATALTTATETQRTALLAKKGWYIRLSSGGEKVLSNAMAIGGILFFNTYQPVTAQSSCQATQGISRGYRVSLLDSTAFSDTRSSVLKGVTLPSNPQIFCQGDSCWAYNDPSQLTDPGTGGGTSGSPSTPEGCVLLPNGTVSCPMGDAARMYWTDQVKK